MKITTKSHRKSHGRFFDNIVSISFYNFLVFIDVYWVFADYK